MLEVARTLLFQHQVRKSYWSDVLTLASFYKLYAIYSPRGLVSTLFCSLVVHYILYSLACLGAHVMFMFLIQDGINWILNLSNVFLGIFALRRGIFLCADVTFNELLAFFCSLL